MVRLSSRKFGRWPRGPASRLSGPRFMAPGFMGGGGAPLAYELLNSLRFRASNSASLSRVPGSSTSNGKTFTYSIWVKRASVAVGAATQYLGATGTTFGAGTYYDSFYFSGDDRLIFAGFQGGTYYGRAETTSVFRDVSQWMHIVLAVDTTLATGTDRIKAWVNNRQVTFTTYTAPAQNHNYAFFSNSGYTSYIGGIPGAYADMHIAHPVFVDGAALTPSSFGQADPDTGEWVPVRHSVTYGAAGFWLKFEDASAATAAAIGKDSSGNANNWTPSGISVTSGVTFDQSLDTPTQNYAVMNPLSKSSTPTPAQGNLFISMGAVYPANVLGSIGVSSGKFYFETSLSGTGGSANGYAVGVATGNWANLNADPGGNSTSYTHLIDSRALFCNNAATTNNSTSFTAGDIIGIAIDADNSTITFYKNNIQVGSAQTLESGQTWFPMFKNSTNAATLEYTANFGQRPFAYTPPSGFKALHTGNLPTPSIKKSSTFFDATLRTGTGATASVSSLGFQPDLVWVKSRSAATDHGLYDAVRGVQKQLESNNTGAETTETTGLTAFNSNGYTVGALAQLNTSAATYVDWAWKEGVTPGFDIVTYVGNGTNRTISHNLGAVPHFIIVKNRTTSPRAWTVYHRNANASPASGALYLNLTDAFAADATNWNNTLPTSSVFSVGTADRVNQNTDNLVAYLWSEIEGFSKFGSYTGNGSTDGPFVWCGFRPKFVLVKNKDAAVDWVIQDAARSASNPSDPTLYPDLGNAEGTSENVDFLSNGFKLRNTLSRWNANANTFVFAAFAEAPFKYARAR